MGAGHNQGVGRVLQAFVEKRAFRLKNDEAVLKTGYNRETWQWDDTPTWALTYHGNTIARWNEDGSLSMSLAGWSTVTTRDRLNQLCDLVFDARPWGSRSIPKREHRAYFGSMQIGITEVITYHPPRMSTPDETVAMIIGQHVFTQELREAAE